MTRGIILFGSSGSGTTTLGREVARRLGFPHYDLDDYLWRKDTPLPFSATWPRDTTRTGRPAVPCMSGGREPCRAGCCGSMVRSRWMAMWNESPGNMRWRSVPRES